MSVTAPRSAPQLARPLWLKLRFWLVLLAIVLLGAAVATALSQPTGRALDPSSADSAGAKALAQVLERYGVTVSRVSSIADADAEAAGTATSVLVLAPDDYSAAQLRELAGHAGRVVLIAPGADSLRAAAPGIARSATTGGRTSPGCAAPGPVATGPVELPAATLTYRPAQGGTATSCYGGALILGPQVAVLGSSALLRNDSLAGHGVAALDVNTLSADRTLRRVVWLMPGTDAAGPGAPSLWQLFPDGAHRAFGWLIVLGVLLVLWRARRLGPVVSEPLPVVVRSAEVVEGHGRLYRRARAHDRAAAALRAGSSQR
ncbi:MAG: DUF4350 domain-containing protein, partial [Jatrophihabitantaceae bacterium]